jgi:hypothetical protein
VTYSVAAVEHTGGTLDDDDDDEQQQSSIPVKSNATLLLTRHLPH